MELRQVFRSFSQLENRHDRHDRQVSMTYNLLPSRSRPIRLGTPQDSVQRWQLEPLQRIVPQPNPRTPDDGIMTTEEHEKMMRASKYKKTITDENDGN